MRDLRNVVVTGGLLCLGVWLLVQGHPVAGGWTLFFGLVCAYQIVA